jgi:hypothetical protein
MAAEMVAGLQQCHAMLAGAPARRRAAARPATPDPMTAMRCMGMPFLVYQSVCTRKVKRELMSSNYKPNISTLHYLVWGVAYQV